MSDRCSDCDRYPSRRHVMGAAAALGAGLMLPRGLQAAPAPTGETLVQQLYGSLNQTQRAAICFGFDDPLRSKVNANWHIVKQRIAQTFNADQQDLIRQIFMSLHSEQYAKSVLGQVEHDNKGGLGACAVALFGTPGAPGSGKFEFVLTGRHVTRRCDGDSVTGAAFGGPIFYGHAARSDTESPRHEDNIYWYQAKTANEVFAALDPKQRELALSTAHRRERGTQTVDLSGEQVGIPVSELSADQQGLVRKTLSDLLAPFRKSDADEAMRMIDAAGGPAKLHMAFFSNQDVGGDGVWDVWQVQGPNMVWYFRGKPHVHTWVNIADPV